MTSKEENEQLRKECYLLRVECGKFYTGMLSVMQSCKNGLEGGLTREALKQAYQRAYNTLLDYRSVEHTKTFGPPTEPPTEPPAEKQTKPPKPYRPFVPEIEAHTTVDNHGNTEIYRTYKATMIRESDQKMKKLTADTEDELFDMIDCWEQNGFTLYDRVTVREDEDKIAGDVDFGF